MSLLVLKGESLKGSKRVVVVENERARITTKKYTFNIARLTSVLYKIDVNTNVVAYL